MEENENFKILIYQKFNRRKKLKTKYLTPELDFEENENKALEFIDFQAAEDFLNSVLRPKKLNPQPRIIIKNFERGWNEKE